MVEGELHRGESEAVGHAALDYAFLLEGEEADGEELPLSEGEGNWTSLVFRYENVFDFLNKMDGTSSISTR